MLRDDEEATVPLPFLVPVPASSGPAVRFARLATQAAKFALQQQPPAVVRALESATVAIRLCLTLLDPEQDSIQVDGGSLESSAQAACQEALFQAIMLKTRVHVLQFKFRAAAADVRQAVMLRPADRKAREMVEIIKQRRARDNAQNRILAKSMTKWIDSAMRQNDQLQSNDQSSHSSSAAEPERQSDSDGGAKEGQGLVGWMRSTFLG